MKVLLIWEEIPESTKLYLLEGDIAETAVKAHGCYVNMVDGDPNDAADALNEALVGETPIDDEEPLILTILTAPVTVVRSGFMM